jgi:hypothetical protein
MQIPFVAVVDKCKYLWRLHPPASVLVTWSQAPLLRLILVFPSVLSRRPIQPTKHDENCADFNTYFMALDSLSSRLVSVGDLIRN